jgi:hypothetical protein
VSAPVKGADAGATSRSFGERRSDVGKGGSKAALLGGAPSFEAQFKQRQTLTKRDPSQETPADKNRQQGRFITVLLDSLRQDFRRDERSGFKYTSAVGGECSVIERELRREGPQRGGANEQAL